MKKKTLMIISIILLSTSLFASSFSLGILSGYENEYLKYNGDNLSLKLDEGNESVPIYGTMHMNIGSHFALSLNGGGNVYLPKTENEKSKLGFGTDLTLYFNAPIGSFMDFNIGAGVGYDYLSIDAISTDFPIIGTISGETSIHTVDVFATVRPIFNLGEHLCIFADGMIGIDVIKEFTGKTNLGLSVEKNLLEENVLGWRWSAKAGILYKF